MTLYTPAQVAKLFGVSTNTIRNYESQGIIPKRLPSGYRKYTIQNIKELVDLLGIDSDEIKKILTDEQN
ncbi:MAG: MerR family DNA-binding transcriptional regulator [Candidatus Pacearchaeota archaeon]|jgi:DNA-binding transcriptional MerR regulator|nr:MerR family DNA-binding transcriptional regulator [Clostridia bacterium]